MSWDLIMHVNYCEQGQTIEEICEKAVAWGYDGVEFRRKRSGVDETAEEYLDSIARGVERSGLKKVLFGGPGADLTSSDVDKREAEIEDMIKFYRLASERFELTVCNTFAGTLLNSDKDIPYSQYDKHGSAAATEEQWEWAAEGFKILGNVAKELNFRFAFETHMCYIHDLPSATKKLVDMIDNEAVGINLDYGNAVYFEDIPSIRETIEEIKPNLYYVHLKNSVRLDDGSMFKTALEDGEINHREYIKILKDVGYKGPICIEAPRAGDREWYAQQDLDI